MQCFSYLFIDNFYIIHYIIYTKIKIIMITIIITKCVDRAKFSYNETKPFNKATTGFLYTIYWKYQNKIQLFSG